MRRLGVTQILSSMRHRKAAYASLVLEVALGCTVAAYSLGLNQAINSIAQQPLGFDLERSFSVVFEQARTTPDQLRTAHELAQLRALPSVETAAWVEHPPLSRCELPDVVMTASGPRLVYSMQGDAELSRALGKRPIRGRALRPDDGDRSGPTPALVTASLAKALGPAPLGARLSSPGLGSLSVVGVLPEPLRVGPFFTGVQELVLLPKRPHEARRTHYLLRTSTVPGRNFARELAQRLRALDPARFVAVEQLSVTREYIARNLGGADTVIFITVLGMALVVLVGSLGMASSLVVERARQIGIRRALGARKVDILGYFMLENLLATGLGLVLSVGLCRLLDNALAPLRGALIIDWPAFIVPAAALFLISGQLAVLAPARRATQIEPSVASRAA